MRAAYALQRSHLKASACWGQERISRRVVGDGRFCEREEAAPGFEPGSRGFADLCLTTWLCRPLSGLELLQSEHYHSEALIGVQGVFGEYTAEGAMNASLMGQAYLSGPRPQLELIAVGASQCVRPPMVRCHLVPGPCPARMRRLACKGVGSHWPGS
jgi:hypothetical protein